METGVVAFFDALGIKGVWARSDPQKIIRAWDIVLETFYDASTAVFKRHPEFEGSFKIAAFSDTVIVTLKGEKLDCMLPVIAQIIAPPFVVALAHSIFFRGIISSGKFLHTENLIIGPAIDEAAEWYTQPNWIGVSVAPSSMFLLKRIVDQGLDLSTYFTEYKVPLSSGKHLKTFALNWPGMVPSRYLDEKKKATGKTILLQAFSNQPIPPVAIEKYINALDFYDTVMGASAEK